MNHRSLLTSMLAGIFFAGSQGCAAETLPQGQGTVQPTGQSTKGDFVQYSGKLPWNARYALRLKVASDSVLDAIIYEGDKEVSQTKRTVGDCFGIVFSEQTDDAIGTADIRVPKRLSRDDKGVLFVDLSGRRVDLILLEKK